MTSFSGSLATRRPRNGLYGFRAESALLRGKLSWGPDSGQHPRVASDPGTRRKPASLARFTRLPPFLTFRLARRLP